MDLAEVDLTRMSYTPKPIDVSSVVLPPELVLLTEKLSENAHDNWSATRLAQGWTLGPERDDNLKKHPCLIPYWELPEHEKDLDRVTVLSTLTAIIALGYEILPPK